MNRNFWTDEARNILRSVLVRKGVTYEQLVERLEEIGVTETVSSVKGKLHRGSFSFVFAMQVMSVLGISQIEVGQG